MENYEKYRFKVGKIIFARLEVAESRSKNEQVSRKGYDSRMSFPRRARMGPCGNIGTDYSSIGEHEFDPRFSYSFLVSLPFSSFFTLSPFF